MFVPSENLESFSESLFEAGAGIIGNYTHNSFSVKGIGRFKPTTGASPFIGKVGELEEVVEERIETVCYKKDLHKIIGAIKKVHPYEEVVVDVYPIL